MPLFLLTFGYHSQFSVNCVNSLYQQDGVFDIPFDNSPPVANTVPYCDLELNNDIIRARMLLFGMCFNQKM